jgi:Xaa-Pro aminopeptidase
MGAIGSCVAIIPRDQRTPVTLVLSAFTHYYIASDMGLAPGVEPIVIGSADRAMFRVRDNAAVTPREKRRRASLAAVARSASDRSRALRDALSGLGIRNGIVGVDEQAARDYVEETAPALATRPCEDEIRRVRMIKTPAEISLMRIASGNNVAAAHAAVMNLRAAPTLTGLRRSFFAEAASRGSTGVFMVVDGVFSQVHEQPIAEGDALMIDCVSHCAGYHGDYARTVFVGEARRSMKAACRAIEIGWNEIRANLRPGLPYSQVREIGVRTLKALGMDYSVSFSPHLVGLHHTDQPLHDRDGRAHDIVLEEGMVVSVDCPLMDADHGGTAHLEDLSLITKDGSVPIHTVADATLTI